MTVIKAALLGFGTVGQGVYEAVHTHEEKLQKILGVKVDIVAVLIKNPDKERSIAENVLVTTDFDKILRIPGLQFVFEAIVGEEPSYTYLQKAIERGCHIITANKVMFARFGASLLEKAKQHGVQVGYEATVAGGVPVLRTIGQQLQINEIEKIQAVLNGTSNFILTEMRTKQLPFEAVLKRAQELGYAEADPSNDIEGLDAFYKLMILSRLAFGIQPKWNQVEVEGISSLTSKQIAEANQNGKRYKHIAEVAKHNGVIIASVRPILTEEHHPLYNVEGVDNAIVIDSSLAGTVTVQGPGAGRKPTASAMIEDFAYILQKEKRELTLQAPEANRVYA